MSSLGVIFRALAPVAGATTGAYLFKENDSFGVRKAFALATGFSAAKTFDDHFPRGEWDFNWDFRDASHLVNSKKYEKATDSEKKTMLDENKATATRNIILIRHGQYVLDSKDKFLTELGREQAILMGERLARTGIAFDKLTMSTMNRATETANLILGKLPKDLKRASCSLIEEGPPYPPIPDIAHWKPSNTSIQNTILEQICFTNRKFLEEYFTEAARIESGFRRHIHRASPSQKEDSYEVIVCHANVIRYFVCRALQFPPEGWLRMNLANASLTWLVVRPNGRVSIRALGDAGHLPNEKLTFT